MVLAQTGGQLLCDPDKTYLLAEYYTTETHAVPFATAWWQTLKADLLVPEQAQDEGSLVRQK